jgi:hemerythrin
MIIWKPEYEIGIELIDQQHQKLFEIGNRAYQLLKNDLYIDKYDEIIEIIDELKKYTVFHFRTEEEYLISKGYKGIFTHKVEHDDFIQKFEEIDFNRIENGQNQYILEILDFILNWIKDHILVTDRKYSLDIANRSKSIVQQ